MAYEPPPVPYVPGEITQTSWYCLECGYASGSAAQTEWHWRNQHGATGENPVNGVDYCLGSQFVLMRIRREKWIEEQAERFAREMHAEFGAEDFVAEAEIRGA